MHFNLAVLLLAAGLSVDPSPCPPPWSYSGPTGPDHWGQFARVCEEGERQSPIDLASTTSVDGRLSFHYNELGKPARVFNSEREVKIYNGTRPFNFVRVNGVDWPLVEFHWHTPAEHTFGGASPRPMEIHFVHNRGGSENVAVGVTVIEDSLAPPNTALQSVLSLIAPTRACVPYQTDLAPVDLTRLLPARRSYFSYLGSLTTPLCDQTLTWFVLIEPIKANMIQLEQLRGAWHPNARPPQRGDGRAVTVWQGTRK